MPTFVLMTKLGADVLNDPRGREERGKNWKKRIQTVCPEVKWKAHYALLGPYDFMDIYEAPNEEVAFKVSLMSRMEGALSAESWPATPYKDLLPVFEELRRLSDK
jgi:uncharacterized protein with GYD domain